MKKNLLYSLLLTLFILGGSLSASARIIYGTESDVVAATTLLPNGGVTADGDVLTFPNAWWNGLSIEAAKGVDPQQYGKFSYTVESWAVGEDAKTGVPFRIEMFDADGTNIGTLYGQTSVSIPTNCTKIVLNAAEANTKVTNLQITMGNKVISRTDDEFASLIELSSNNAGAWTSGIPSFPKTLPQATVLFGNGEGSGESVWADVSDYEKLSFVVSDVAKAGSQLRVWMWTGNGVATLYPHLESEYESVTDWTAVNGVTTAGTYVVKLPVGYKLKGVKTNWDGAECTVSDVYLTKYASYPDVVLYPQNGKNAALLSGKGNAWTNSVVYPMTFQSQDKCWGVNNGSSQDANNYVDISGYNKMSFYVTKGSDKGLGIRLWVWNDTGIKEIYAHPEADYETANFNTAYMITEPGIYSVNIEGYDVLQGVKATNRWDGQTPIIVDYAWVSNGETIAAIDEARTYSHPFILDFTNVEDVEAYIATACDGSKVTMKKVEGAVPANTGLVLKQVNDKAVISIPTCGKATEDVTGNLLVATTAATEVTEGSYVLAGAGESLGWYFIGTTKPTLAAGKSYLSVAATGKKLEFAWGDDATAADAVEAKAVVEDGAWYTITGVKVAAPTTKGIYIKNGKKVTVNN